MALQDPPLPEPTAPPGSDPSECDRTVLMRPCVTLDTINRASSFLSVTAVAKAAGLPRQTLFTRIRRGGPELTTTEIAAVMGVLEAAGIVLGTIA